MRWMLVVVIVGFALTISVVAQEPSTPALHPDADKIRVILLGSGGGPAPNPQRLGISTLIVAGPERLMFDCGRRRHPTDGSDGYAAR